MMGRGIRARRDKRANLTSLALLQAILLAAHGSTGCLGETVPIGGMDAGASGEGATDGAPSSGGSSGSTSGNGGSAGKGGRGGQGGSIARGGFSGTGGSAGVIDPAGGEPGMNGGAGTGSSGVSGSAGSAGGGGVSGTSGTAGFAGSAGSAGSGLTGGDAGGGGTAGSAGSAGTAGSAGAGEGGDSNVPDDRWLIGPPNDIGCTSGSACDASFQWRDSTIPVGTSMGDYVFADLSADGQWLVGSFDGPGDPRSGAFKFMWNDTALSLLVFGNTMYPAAVTADGDMLVGRESGCPSSSCVSSAVFEGLGPTMGVPGVPATFFATAVSDNGSVIVTRDTAYTAGYIVRNDIATLVPDIGFDAVSGDGAIAGGTRAGANGGAVIVDGSDVIDIEPVGDWTPRVVMALNHDGRVAVGYAQQPGDGSGPTQAYRWEQGVGTTLLGFPEGTTSSRAYDCDASGDLVVGTGFTTLYETFLYRPSEGMRTLRDDLIEHSVPQIPSGLQLSGTVRVSADGTTIAGGGVRGIYNMVWIAKYTGEPPLVSTGDE